ncbi:uncharacterized protein LOC122500829 [Leptopilina heterotoma]|uniref:uncharacterized protein LOC122500829 n=1 Tax=Leptopilina heterotoma TaxID=63436 RepID=UPI001CA7F561|nr:uncharacterized protein LOC122500829 [Leptopilina heterotoma]
MLPRRLMFSYNARINPERKRFSKSSLTQVQVGNSKVEKSESVRMQKFHEKLKADVLPPEIDRSMRFIDLVLVETDPKSGEIIPNSEKEPTKWGDWQHGGRVTDF